MSHDAHSNTLVGDAIEQLDGPAVKFKQSFDFPIGRAVLDRAVHAASGFHVSRRGLSPATARFEIRTIETRREKQNLSGCKRAADEHALDQLAFDELALDDFPFSALIRLVRQMRE
jgi:hypothetical protein